MSRLARIDGFADAKVIAETTQRICQRIEPAQEISWPNKRRAKEAEGRWRYPTLRIAKEADGRWRYPSLRIAKEVDGRWRYPSLRIAKEANGTWRRPDLSKVKGLDELLDWACKNIGQPTCDARADIFTTSGEERDAAAIEWAWRAYQSIKR
jgi:hypothetical protein